MTDRETDFPSPSDPVLRCQRLRPADWAGAAATALGGLGWGLYEPPGEGLAALDTRLLSGDGAWVDAWQGDAPWRAGRSGAVHWRSDGDWAFGQLQAPDAGVDLAEAARRAYLDLFAALADTGTPQLLRLWNYLPRINDEAGGLERYRQFNIGRQRAFIESGHDAFEGAPAACALGTAGGGLNLRFLAGRRAPLPLENPRQVPAYRYSDRFGPRSPTFSRAALVEAGAGRVALLVSGTASIVGEQSLHPGDVRAQAAETLRNLQAVVDAAHRRCTARFTLADLVCTVYVRHAGDTESIRDVFDAGVGRASPAARQAVYLQADICRSELLVEIEGHAFAPGRTTA